MNIKLLKKLQYLIINALDPKRTKIGKFNPDTIMIKEASASIDVKEESEQLTRNRLRTIQSLFR